MSRAATQVSIIVNEPRLNAAGSEQARDWWFAFWATAPTGRIHAIQATIGGCVCEVACDSLTDADTLLAVMMANGMPRSAIKIARGPR
ncbi:MAG: hypothetical protein WCF04_02240 [Candidatus Nanopelagicales bacterium]